MSELLNRGIGNALNSSLGAVAVACITIIFAGMRIRFLGAEQAGFLMFCDTLVNISAMIGGFGLTHAVVLRVAELIAEEKSENAARVVSSILGFSLILALFIFMILMCLFSLVFDISKLSEEYRADALLAYLFCTAALACSMIMRICDAVLKGLQRFGVQATLNSLFALVASISGLVVLLIFPSMWPVALVSCLVMIVRFFVTKYVVEKLLGEKLGYAIFWLDILSVLKFSTGSFLTQISFILRRGADRIIVTAIGGADSLAYYAFSQNMLMRCHELINSSAGFLFPMVTEYGNKGVGVSSIVIQSQDRLRWITSFWVAFSYGLIAIVALPILEILTGSDYAKIAWLPLVLSTAQGFFVALNIVPYNLTLASSLSISIAVASYIAGVISLSSGYFFVKQYGVEGMIIAQWWGILPAFIVCTILLKHHKFFSIYNLLRPILIPFILFTVCFGLALNLWFTQSSSYYHICSSLLVAVVIALCLMVLEQKCFPATGSVKLCKKIAVLLCVRIFKNA